MTRSRGAVVFFCGAATAVVFGAVLAAYDLWGGVPRHLWRVMRVLLIGAVGGMGFGGVAWVRSFEPAERPRAMFKAAAVLGGFALICGGGLFGHYAIRLDSSRAICAPALIAPSLQARREALRKGLGPLFPVIDPHGSCLHLKRELDAFDGDRTCPTFPPDDIECRCGKQRWRATHALRCKTKPTSCQWRKSADGSSLGCPEHGALHTLKEARGSL